MEIALFAGVEPTVTSVQLREIIHKEHVWVQKRGSIIFLPKENNNFYK